MCGKGSQTTTQQTSQTSSPNPQAMSAYENILGQAGGVAAAPYQAYGGELVSPVNQQQYAGIGNINAYQPAFDTALGMAYQGAQPITNQQIQQYESPYTQQVVNATQAQFNNQNAQQQQQVLGSAAAQGALGGNRVGVAQAELANQQQLAQAPVIANLENQGYNTGLNTALTEQQALEQGAYGVGNAANAGLSGANAQIGAGTLEQQTGQALDQALYQQYLNQLAYPFQTTQWLAGIDTGVGSQMGGTTTGTGTSSQQSNPSLMSELGGIGSIMTGLGGSAGLLSFLARGGGVAGYAEGGGVAGPNWSAPSTIPESHATLHAQRRQLMNGDRKVQMYPDGHGELPVPAGMRRTTVNGHVFHHHPSVHPNQIKHAMTTNQEHHMLGLGPHGKHEVMHRISRGERPVAVVERDQHGTEVRAALGTHSTAAAQHAHMSRGASKGHRVTIEHPHKVLRDRLVAHRQSGGSVTNYSQFGGGFGAGVMPYGGGTSFVPTIGITPGRGAPNAMQMAPPANNSGQTNPTQAANFAKGITGSNGGSSQIGSFWNNRDSTNAGNIGSFGIGATDDNSVLSGNDIEDPDALDMDLLNEGVDPSSSDYLDASDFGEDNWRGGGIANRAAGGNVTPTPMSLDQMEGAMKRLTQDMSQPQGVANRDVGGVPNRDAGGDVGTDQTDTGYSDPTQITVPMKNPPMPTPRPAPPVSPDVDPEALAFGSPDGQPPLPQPRPAVASQGVAPAPTAQAAPPRGIRNNNPGNIEDGPFAQSLPGYTGSDGRFAQFDTMENGQNATSTLLGHYGDRGLNTISSIVNRWAPAADNNNTNAYISAVAKATGYGPNEKLDMNDPAVRSRIGNAIVAHENGIPASGSGQYNRAYESDVRNMELSGRGRGYGSEAIQGVVPPDQKPGIDFSAQSNLWPALIAAGGAMMASRATSPWQAIGEGVQAGAQTYYGMKQAQQAQSLNERKMNLEAQKLSDDLNFHEKELSERALEHSENLAEKKREAQQKIQTLPGEDGKYHWVRMNPDGETYTDIMTNEVFGKKGNTLSKTGDETPAPTQRQWGPQAQIPSLRKFNDPTTPFAQPGMQAGGTPPETPDAPDNAAPAAPTDPDMGWAGSVGTDTPAAPVAPPTATPTVAAGDVRSQPLIAAGPDPDLTNVPTTEQDPKTGLPVSLNMPADRRNYGYLQSLDPDRASLIQGISDYRLDPTKVSSMRPGKFQLETERKKLMEDVLHFDPSYDMRYYAPSQEAISSFMSKNTPNSPISVMTAGNVAIKHEAQLYNLVHQIKNLPQEDQGWFTKTMDAVTAGADALGLPYADYYLQHFKNSGIVGTKAGELLRDWALAQDRYSAEVTKFYAGSGVGTQEERNKSANLFDPNLSEEELKGALAQDLQMLHDKVSIYTNRVMGALRPAVWREVASQNPEMFTMYKETADQYHNAMAAEANRQAQKESGRIPPDFLGAPGWTKGKKGGVTVWKAPNGRVLPINQTLGQ